MSGGHGTRGDYVRGCRCDECRRANREYARMLYRRAAYAEWDPGVATLIDAGPAREHVAALRAAGLGKRTIATRAGVSLTVVARLLGVDHYRPANRIRPATADKLLSVAPTDLADKALVDGTGTQRRLRALIAIGYTQTDIARRIGWTVSNLGPLLYDRGRVTAGTARLVADLFTQLEMTPGPRASARDRAARKGWAPPLAWDANTIDDPNAQPSHGRARPAVLEDYQDTYWEHRGDIRAAAVRLGLSEGALEQALRRARRDGISVDFRRGVAS